jgi:hypothetical protein
MSSSKPFSISSLPSFEKELGKIITKYPHFKESFEHFKESLKTNPEQGSHLGSGVYKVRLEIPGKPAGKSYGARVIHAIFTVSSEVLLMLIYDKSYIKDLTKAQEAAFRKLANELRKKRKSGS